MTNNKIFDILIDNSCNYEHKLDKKYYTRKNSFLNMKINILNKKKDKLGIILDYDKKGNIYISGVKNNSVASEAGVISNSYIYCINGINVRKMDISDILKLINNSTHIEMLLGVIDDFEKYVWNDEIRVVKRNGKVTNICEYDDNGFVEVDNNQYKIVNCAYKLKKSKKGKKNKYDGAILKCDKKQINEHSGFMIHDIVYKYLISHKNYKLIKHLNLFDKLLEFSKSKKRDTKSVKRFLGDKDISIYSKKSKIKSNSTKMAIIENKNDKFFINPYINNENRERILDIIDKFINFCIKN
tara:strand:+ start:88 stop:981 length:894 start_codon:yes stop_codon:yes gene_type:complete